jgi:hypothetical protein
MQVPEGFNPISQGLGNVLQTVQALNSQGIQASTQPHPNEVGWADYGNGLWVYEPHGPNQPEPLGDQIRSDLASISDPYLAQNYKDAAIQNLMHPGGTPGGAIQPENPANYDSLKQSFAQTIADKGRELPGSLQPAPIPAPAPTDISAPMSPAPAPSSPISSVVNTESQSPVVTAAPVNTQQLGNRSLPGFAAVNHRNRNFAPVAARFLGTPGGLRRR